MIRHIVFFSAKDPADAQRIRNALREKLGPIPHHRHFEAHLNAKHDSFGNQIDVVVYAEFDSRADLEAYRKHPLYAESVALVRPLRELRFAADYDTDEEAAA